MSWKIERSYTEFRMGFAALIFLHGLGALLDGIFGLLIRLCWLTAILITTLGVKRTIESVRTRTTKILLIFAVVICFLLVSAVCLLLFPNNLVSTTTSPLDPRPLVDLGSAIVWLTISLDVWAMVEFTRSESGGAGRMMLILFLPIVGATYFLISNRRVTHSVPTADTRDK